MRVWAEMKLPGETGKDCAEKLLGRKNKTGWSDKRTHIRHGHVSHCEEPGFFSECNDKLLKC